MSAVGEAVHVEEIDEDEELEALRAEAEARRDEERAAVAAARPQHIAVPKLAEGKTHHLFISHAEEDTDWAEALIKKLENERGLACCWYKRDFKPGTTIASSIQNAMMSCMKTLFILTPDFLESNWCLSELDWATGLSVCERSSVMIPLLLKPCDLPAVFTNFIYIDVPKGQDYVDRIVRSFDPGDDTQKLKVHRVEFRPQTGCGLSKHFKATKNVDSMIRGTAWTFKELPLEQIDDLNEIGSELASDMYERVRKLVNNSSHLRFNPNRLQYFLLGGALSFLIGITFILMFFLIITYTLALQNTFYLIPAAIVALLSVPVALFKFKQASYRKLNRAVIKLSMENVRDSDVLVFYTKWAELEVMYCDVHPCIEHMAEMILKRRLELHPNGNIEQFKLQARLDAENKIMRYLSSNMESVMNWKFAPDSCTTKHQTYLNKMCLCERINQ